MRKTGSIKTIISLILAGEVIFILPFILPRIFRPTILDVFQIDNLSLGSCFSIYGLVAMVSYFFGGPIADRYPARNLISSALILTGLGGIFLAFNMNEIAMKFTYGYWGFTTIFLFWAAMIKATREWGSEDFQGRAYGLLEGGRGLTGALIGSLAVIIFTSYMPIDFLEKEARIGAYQNVLFIISILVIFIGTWLLISIPKKINQGAILKSLPKPAQVLVVLKERSVWMQAVIIICAYVGYKSTDDFSLYAKEVLHFGEINSAKIGSLGIWLRPVFAVVAGLLADRFSGQRVVIWCFVLMILGSLTIFSGVFISLLVPSILLFLFTMAGIYGIRGVYFAMMKDSGIPLHATGIAVGIMSVLGYTPDVFMSPLMGYLLDSYPGNYGHQLVFLVISIFSIIGLIIALLLSKEISKISHA